MSIVEDREAAPRELTAPERKARRRRVLQWVLPVAGVALIAGTFVVTQVLLAGGLGTPRPADPDEVSATNTTQFGEAGTAYAVQYQVVTLNLSELPLTADALGMPANAEAVIAPGYGFLDTTAFRGQGGGLDGQGYFREMMSSVTATTSGGVVQRIDAERSPVGWAEFPSAMRAVETGVEAFGWQIDDADLEAFTDRAAEAVRQGQPASLEIPAGDAMAMPVSGRVDCTGDGLCVVSYSFETR
ncbi:hypothetical protein OVA14_08335 [Agrococcus sp. SL85]|uniref:hypothetical protein n=1 Tax=Agrococcus sp. SL85 TaxID=2995141 RepID=UPI00226CB284|nr:hypothetical protein [Agrococcus sp. SL85]WAC65384.1 hypothetical protein OVA14_08335 [Agrococcus sp. SL85]